MKDRNDSKSSFLNLFPCTIFTPQISKLFDCSSGIKTLIFILQNSDINEISNYYYFGLINLSEIIVSFEQFYMSLLSYVCQSNYYFILNICDLYQRTWSCQIAEAHFYSHFLANILLPYIFNRHMSDSCHIKQCQIVFDTNLLSDNCHGLHKFAIDDPCFNKFSLNSHFHTHSLPLL